MQVAKRYMDEIVKSAGWPAWAKYGAAVPRSFQNYLETVYLVQNNSITNNYYCDMHPGPFCIGYDPNNCLVQQMNHSTYNKSQNGCCCSRDLSMRAFNGSCPAAVETCHAKD